MLRPPHVALTARARTAARVATAALGKRWEEQGTDQPQSEYDVDLAFFYGAVIAAALAAQWPPPVIAAAVVTAAQWAPPAGAPAAAVSAAEALIAASVRASLDAHRTQPGTARDADLTAALEGLIADAWTTGTHAAARQLRIVDAEGSPALIDTATGELLDDIDWDTWRPGRFPAGAVDRIRADPDVRALYENVPTLIRGLTDTTVQRITDRVTRGVLDGESIDRITRDVTPLVDDPRRARLIAHTETARVQTTATLRLYQVEDVTAWDWIASDGACPACDALARGGPYPLTAQAPPLHPACRCSPAPGVAG